MVCRPRRTWLRRSCRISHPPRIVRSHLVIFVTHCIDYLHPDGLLTPPATPQRYARVAHPELNPFLASPTYMRWNMGTALPNIPELSNDKLIQAATAPGVTTMRIRHIFFAITFVISAGHALTLGDVLMGLRAELSRRESTSTPCHALYSPRTLQLIHVAKLGSKCSRAESISVVLCRMTPPPTSGFSQRTKVVVLTLILLLVIITTIVILLCFRRLKTVTALLPRTKSDTNIEHSNAPLLNNG